MKRLLPLLCVALSCAPPFKEPTPQERELPAMGEPPRQVLPKYSPDAADFTLPDSGCCPVRFAYPAGTEVSAELFGFGEPLPFAGLPLSKDGGTWERTVCMGHTRSLYAYRLLLRADVSEDGGLFPLVSWNPNVPSIVSAQYGLLNEFDASDAGTCAEFAVAAHADISRPDAGVLIYPDGGDEADAGTDAGSSSDGGVVGGDM